MEPCKPDIFRNGHSICMLDACMHRAEWWVQEVARISGQPVDWHYSGGIANVLHLGDYDKVDDAAQTMTPAIGASMVRRPGECGGCSGHEHAPGRLLRLFGPTARGPYRAGDPLPPGALGVDTH